MPPTFRRPQKGCNSRAPAFARGRVLCDVAEGVTGADFEVLENNLKAEYSEAVL